jgi:hypothetical protein
MKSKTSDDTAGGVVLQRMVRPLERLSTSIYAIVALYDAAELTEGQATKLMNCGDRVSWRLRREQIHAEMKELLTKDVESHGWKWPNAELTNRREKPTT